MRHSVFEFDNLSIAALVSVLPELVAESDPKEALKQVALPSSTCLWLQILVEKEKVIFYKANCVYTLFERWAASSLVLPSWVGSPSSEQEQESIWKQVVGKCEDKLLSMIFCKTSCELKPVPTLTVIIVLMTLLNKLVGKGRKELKYIMNIWTFTLRQHFSNVCHPMHFWLVLVKLHWLHFCGFSSSAGQ